MLSLLLAWLGSNLGAGYIGGEEEERPECPSCMERILLEQQQHGVWLSIINIYFSSRLFSLETSAQYCLSEGRLLLGVGCMGGTESWDWLLWWWGRVPLLDWISRYSLRFSPATSCQYLLSAGDILHTPSHTVSHSKLLREGFI